MSFSQPASTTPQATNPKRTNDCCDPRPTPMEPQRFTSNASFPSSGSSCHGSAIFSRGTASAAEDSMTSTRSEEFAQFQPCRHPNIPQQPPESQFPPHVNPQTWRVLTAADFSRHHPRQSDFPGLVIYNDLPTFDFAVSPQSSPETSSKPLIRPWRVCK